MPMHLNVAQQGQRTPYTISITVISTKAISTKAASDVVVG